MTDVQFEIHGATCKTCDMHIAIYMHCGDTRKFLATFQGEHGTHDGFAWITKISAPAEMVTGQQIEVALTTHRGRMAKAAA